jgi:hypothetical protein
MSDHPDDVFDCGGCGCGVIRFGFFPDQPKLCAGCTFLTWLAPADRAEMRAHMLGRGIIGPDKEDA